MAFGISTHNLPMIRSFEEAENFFKRTDPVRSAKWGTEQRPLAARREFHKRIEKHTTLEGEDSYHLILFDTALIAYYKEGRVALRTYDTRSTHDFMWGLMPHGLSPHSNSGRMMIKALTRNGPAWYAGGKPLVFAQDERGTGQWVLLTEAPERYRQVLCHKKAAAIRKAAKPFITWVKTTRKLLGVNRLPNDNHLARAYATTLTSFTDFANTEIWPNLEITYVDTEEWRLHMYTALGALTIEPISNLEPPKRNKHNDALS